MAYICLSVLMSGLAWRGLLVWKYDCNNDNNNKIKRNKTVFNLSYELLTVPRPSSTCFLLWSSRPRPHRSQAETLCPQKSILFSPVSPALLSYRWSAWRLPARCEKTNTREGKKKGGGRVGKKLKRLKATVGRAQRRLITIKHREKTIERHAPLQFSLKWQNVNF